MALSSSNTWSEVTVPFAWVLTAPVLARGPRFNPPKLELAPPPSRVGCATIEPKSVLYGEGLSPCMIGQCHCVVRHRLNVINGDCLFGCGRAEFDAMRSLSSILSSHNDTDWAAKSTAYKNAAYICRRSPTLSCGSIGFSARAVCPPICFAG